jgi:hypothetical protein
MELEKKFEYGITPITLKERIMGVLKYHSIKKETDKFNVIEECDWSELTDNLITCFEQFGEKNRIIK